MSGSWLCQRDAPGTIHPATSAACANFMTPSSQGKIDCCSRAKLAHPGCLDASIAESSFIPRSRASAIPATLLSEHELWILQARPLLALRTAAQGIRRNRESRRQRIRWNNSGGSAACRPIGANGGHHSRPSLPRAGIVLLRLHRTLSRAGRDEHRADDPDGRARNLHRLRHLPASLSRTGERRADAATANLPCPAGRLNRAGDDHANPAFSPHFPQFQNDA